MNPYSQQFNIWAKLLEEDFHRHLPTVTLELFLLHQNMVEGQLPGPDPIVAGDQPEEDEA